MLSIQKFPVTLNLLILNVVISAVAFLAQPQLLDRWGVRPYMIIRHHQWYRMLSGGFLHGSWMHLAFNMLSLWSFGPYMEYQLGAVPYLVLYFGSMLAAHALTTYKYQQQPSYNAVGASGAISGVILGFCLYEPFQRLLVFFVPMPAIVFAVLYIGYSVYASRSGQGEAWGNIAHEAHLGGALAGIVITILFDPRAILHFFS